MLNKLFFIGRVSAIATILLIGGSASAAVAEWKSFEQKVAEADAIVRGELISSESRRDPDGRWIRTWSTFRVDEVLKGNAASGTVTIITPGGTVDGIHQETVGTPSFAPGREQVLFLDNTAEGIVPLYLEQGVYDVTRDDRNRLLVRPSPSNLILYDDQAGKVVPAEATRTIDDFRGEIRRASIEQQRDIARSSAIEGKRPETSTWRDLLSENALLLVLLAIGLLIGFITWIRKQ